MPLNKPNDNASTAAFESEDYTNTVDNAADTAAESPAAAPAASESRAVAAQGTRAVATSSARSVVSTNVLSDKKDAFHVDYDSTPSIRASQGSFSFKDDDEELGTEIQIDLMSYQDSWVAGPNDTKAPIETVKWADNAVTSRDGVDLQQHVNDLKAQGWSKATITHRCIIVGELIKAGTESARIGQLVQCDLPESGRRSFNAHTLQASFAVGKGRKTKEEAAVLTLKAVKDKSKSGEIYTKIVFS